MLQKNSRGGREMGDGARDRKAKENVCVCVFDGRVEVWGPVGGAGRCFD